MHDSGKATIAASARGVGAFLFMGREAFLGQRSGLVKVGGSPVTAESLKSRLTARPRPAGAYDCVTTFQSRQDAPFTIFRAEPCASPHCRNEPI